MAKFIYIGDPNGGKNLAGFVSYKDPKDGKVIVVNSEPSEVPDWLASKLKSNTHFKEVVEAVAPAA